MGTLGKKQNFGKIGVLMGGPSSERNVSLRSGKAVYESLSELGLDVVSIDITTDNIEENLSLISSHKIDCAFLALHGRFGEDGKIQEILDYMNVRYTGSGVLASRLSMDKIASRRILEIYGLAVPKYSVIEKDIYNENKKFKNNFIFPLVIKPSSAGSSIGLSIIDNEQAMGSALDLAFNYDDTVLIEEYILGRELTVGILDDAALPVVGVLPKKRFFDYEAKYQAGMTEYSVPADLAPVIARKVQSVAIKAHELLGCYGCSRVDIILSNDFTPFILELNSIPGFTPTSLLPKAAKFAGIDFSALCIKLIELAYEKTKNRISG